MIVEHYLHAVLHLSSNIAVNSDGINITCTATGYPDVQLLMWQTGTGLNISEMQHTTISQEHEYNNTLTSTLRVSTEMCGRSRGYMCTFSNGGTIPIYHNSSIHCPPGMLLVQSLKM